MSDQDSAEQARYDRLFILQRQHSLSTRTHTHTQTHTSWHQERRRRMEYLPMCRYAADISPCINTIVTTEADVTTYLFENVVTEI